MKLSVVIPAYNEINTLGQVIAMVGSVLPGVDKEIIIIDDGSTDGTREWLDGNLNDASEPHRRVELVDNRLRLSSDGEAEAGRLFFVVLFHERNKGKGGAIRTGLGAASGDVIVIQDADLEFDPRDWE